MSDSGDRIPDVAPTPPVEGGSDLAELWRNLWPWDDLNAKGPPERWLHLGRDVLPVLASMVASAGPTPKLLSSTQRGELLAAANIAPGVSAVVPSAAGQANVILPDTSPFHPGDIVNVTSGLVTPPVSTSTLTFVKSVQVGSITLAAQLNAICNVGDVVTRIAPIGIYGQPIGVSQRIRSWQVQSFHQPGAGIRADLVLAAVAGMQYVITHARGRIVATVAAADGANWSINPGSTIVDQEITGCQAAPGANDEVEDNDAAWVGNIGGAPEIAFRTPPQNANNQQSASVGGYLIMGEPV